jgi:DNA invertase Pin-like site-specific DNA recombinase
VPPRRPKPTWESWPPTPDVWAWPYGRLSEEEKRDKKLSLPVQKRVCRETIAAQAWIPGEWESDVDSGFLTDLQDRAGIMRQIARVRAASAAGKAAVLVVRDVDRLGRKAWQVLQAYDELEDAGARIWTYREQRFLTPEDAGHAAVQAETESRTKSARHRDNVRETYLRGYWFPRTVNWGYRKVQSSADAQEQGAPCSTLAPEPAQALRVRECFERYRDGASERAVARWAGTLSAAERGGRRLGYALVHKTLRNRIYVAETPDGHPGRWPALIDRPLWNAVQARLEGRAQRPAAQASGQYLLTGYLWCECGARMHGSAGQIGDGRACRAFRRYRCVAQDQGTAGQAPCSRTASAGRLEGFVEARLLPLLEVTRGDAVRLERHARVWDEEVAALTDGGAGRALRQARARLQACEEALGKLMADYRRPDGDPDKLTELEYTAGRKRLAAEHAALGAEVARLEPEAQRAGPPPARLADALAVLGQRALGWGAMTVTERRAVLADLVLRVEVVRDPQTARTTDARVTWTSLGDGLAWVLAQEA